MDERKRKRERAERWQHVRRALSLFAAVFIILLGIMYGLAI